MACEQPHIPSQKIIVYCGNWLCSEALCFMLAKSAASCKCSGQSRICRQLSNCLIMCCLSWMRLQSFLKMPHQLSSCSTGVSEARNGPDSVQGLDLPVNGLLIDFAVCCVMQMHGAMAPLPGYVSPPFQNKCFEHAGFTICCVSSICIPCSANSDSCQAVCCLKVLVQCIACSSVDT